MIIFKDSATLDLSLNKDQETGMRDIPGAVGLKWAFRTHINTLDKVTECYIKVVGGSVTVKTTLRSTSSKYFKIEEDENSYQTDFIKDGEQKLCSHQIFGSYIKCNIQLELMQWIKRANVDSLTVHEMIDPSINRCSDAKITVGENEVKIHRGFLSMISPVFEATFASHTKEAQTGILDIKDFSFETVKKAIDYCYGGNFIGESAVEVIDVLRFYDKYDIPVAIRKLEVWLSDNITVKDFFPIAAYAWQYSRKGLQEKCGKVYRNNIVALACNPAFAELDPTVIVGVVRASAVASK